MSNYRAPEAYFDRDTVDAQQLLRYCLLEGSDNIVDLLLEKGTKLSADDCDDEGKTVLHLAAMCEDDEKAMATVKIVYEHIDSDAKKKSLVLKRERRGRTALHEADLNGNKELCEHFMFINPNLVYLEDKDGRAPIYDAASGKHNEEDIVKKFLNIYSKKNIYLTDFTEQNGLTLLHVAASLGKKDLVRFILSHSKNDGRDSNTRGLLAQDGLEYLKRRDFLGQTTLHKAANCAECDTVQILLNEGAHPFEERDCDGRTALHYVVKAKTQGEERKLIDLLLQKCKTSEEKWIFLWASATGLGTADEILSNDDPLHQFLEGKKNEIKQNLTTTNLLKTV